MKLLATKVFTGKLEVATGLHIGGSTEAIEIGGIDNPIIKHPVTHEPYIPGSSLKGKMRSQMEKKEGKIENDGKPCGCGKQACMVCRVFGPHFNPRHNLGPTRILVRDAMLSEESRREMQEAMQAGKSYIEIKTENIIDRNIGTAKHPRQQERVPAGATFDLEIGVQVLDLDREQNMDVVGYVQKALKAVEESYIGGSGSRGYGKVRFTDLNLDGEPVSL